MQQSERKLALGGLLEHEPVTEPLHPDQRGDAGLRAALADDREEVEVADEADRLTVVDVDARRVVAPIALNASLDQLARLRGEVDDRSALLFGDSHGK